MSHQERNSVRAAYIHKAEHMEERRPMLQWWSDYLDACKSGFIPLMRLSGKMSNIFKHGC